MLADAPKDRHRDVAGRFSRVVRGVTDWDAPTPVAGWTARDVVGHLVDWFPAFLAAGAGIELTRGAPVDEDPAGAWETQARAVQHLLDDPDADATIFDNPHTGRQPLPTAVNRFYTADVFMHTWDLAVASGQDAALDEDFCANLLAGMLSMEAVIRGSGQYGDAVVVAGGASAQDRLLGFIGRDPAWTPAGS